MGVSLAASPIQPSIDLARLVHCDSPGREQRWPGRPDQSQSSDWNCSTWCCPVSLWMTTRLRKNAGEIISLYLPSCSSCLERSRSSQTQLMIELEHVWIYDRLCHGLNYSISTLGVLAVDGKHLIVTFGYSKVKNNKAETSLRQIWQVWGQHYSSLCSMSLLLIWSYSMCNSSYTWESSTSLEPYLKNMRNNEEFSWLTVCHASPKRLSLHLGGCHST